MRSFLDPTCSFLRAWQEHGPLDTRWKGSFASTCPRLRERPRDILYRFCTDPLLFRPFCDLSNFVKSVSYGTSKTCQVRGSNPCQGASQTSSESLHSETDSRRSSTTPSKIPPRRRRNWLVALVPTWPIRSLKNGTCGAGSGQGAHARNPLLSWRHLDGDGRVARSVQGAGRSGCEFCALVAPSAPAWWERWNVQRSKFPGFPPSLSGCLVAQPSGVNPSEIKPNQTNPDRYRQVEDLFHAALDQGPEYLDTACAGDPGLRAEVEALLASYRSWSASLPPVAAPVFPHFGAYQCDGILGSGGMGTVYQSSRPSKAKKS
jgi:hypothetical protein